MNISLAVVFALRSMFFALGEVATACADLVSPVYDRADQFRKLKDLADAIRALADLYAIPTDRVSEDDLEDENNLWSIARHGSTAFSIYKALFIADNWESLCDIVYFNTSILPEDVYKHTEHDKLLDDDLLLLDLLCDTTDPDDIAVIEALLDENREKEKAYFIKEHPIAAKYAGYIE